jgi:RNA polymerase sigma-70 factor (ECF subfamily)
MHDWSCSTMAPRLGADEATSLPSMPIRPAMNLDRDQRAGMDRFLAGVERRALRMAQIAVGSSDEALDIVQDAMLQLARRYGDRPQTEWPPLFYRILENRIRDFQRRQTVKRKIFGWMKPPTDDDSGEDQLALVADPDRPEAVDILKQAEAMKVLSRALRRLPARQREAFELRVWEGLSVDETARAMGCTDGSVKTHLSRALHALRAQLDGVWP